MTEPINTSLNLAFWFHLFITILAWIGPFLLPWYVMVFSYSVVTIQFYIFGRCLLNKSHNLKDENSATFYSVLFNLVHISHNPKKLKFWVRNWFYPILALFTLVLQLVFKYRPLINL
jgi:hypothetical protein